MPLIGAVLLAINVAALTDVITQMRRAPRFARKVQAEWISMAEAALRS